MSDPYQSKPPDHIRFDSEREPANRANSGVGARRSSNFGRKLRFAGLEYLYQDLPLFGVPYTVFLTLRSNKPPLHFYGTVICFLSFSKIPPHDRLEFDLGNKIIKCFRGMTALQMP